MVAGGGPRQSQPAPVSNASSHLCSLWAQSCCVEVSASEQACLCPCPCAVSVSVSWSVCPLLMHTLPLLPFCVQVTTAWAGGRLDNPRLSTLERVWGLRILGTPKNSFLGREPRLLGCCQKACLSQRRCHEGRPWRGYCPPDPDPMLRGEHSVKVTFPSPAPGNSTPPDTAR